MGVGVEVGVDMDVDVVVGGVYICVVCVSYECRCGGGRVICVYVYLGCVRYVTCVVCMICAVCAWCIRCVYHVSVVMCVWYGGVCTV